MYRQQAVDFLKNKQYLKGDETIVDRIDSICSVVKQYEGEYGEEGLSERIKSYINNQIFIPSTPQWANVGREYNGSPNLPASCYILGVENSIQGIYYSFGETAMMSKLGGGIGSSYINVVEKGTKLDEGFHSNSKLDWIEDGLRSSQKVSQGAVRRGYSVPSIYITDVEFYDFMERLDKKNPDSKDPLVRNTGCIVLPKGFWKDFEEDSELKKRFLILIQKRKSKGKIYILDVDNCNTNQSEVYKNLELEVNATNICCVTGDQLVATQEGFKTVKELSDTNLPLQLFDNEAVHNSSAMLYRGNAEVFEVNLKNGMSHTITANHELVVRDSTRKTFRESIDSGLKIGQKVCIQTNKGLFGKRDEQGLAFLLGLFLGDGNKQGNGLRLSLWENDFDLVGEIEEICNKFCERSGVHFHPNSKRELRFLDATSTGDSQAKRKNLYTSIFNSNGLAFKKGEIPHWILDSNEETQWQLLRGLLYSDGTVGDYNTGKSFGQPINLSLANIDLSLLKKVQLICSNLGINSKIYDLKEEGVQSLPKNDGTGDYADYKTNHIYRLVISNKTDLLKVEKNTSFLSRKNVYLEDREYRDNSHKSSEIMSIVSKGKQDVYCPTIDSEKHLWVCNGFITSNTEALTALDDRYSFVCMLASLNLVKYDEIKSDPKIIRDCYIYLDIMVSLFIDLTEGVPFLEKARRSAIDKRDIGLGTMGFTDLLQSKGLAFGGIGSRALNREIFKLLRDVGETYAQEMGDKVGSPKLCQDAGLTRRNVSLMMVAPNKSTSFLPDVSQGIQPRVSNYYSQELAGYEEVVKNPYLEKLLSDIGKNSQEVWSEVLNNGGSVQNLAFLSEDQKAVFKTASEIAPKDIIDLAADRQVYIDMGQSLNLFGRPQYTTKDVYDMHRYAFSRGIKTLYYYFAQGHAAIEHSSGSKWDDCESCAD
jgi:ribonucleoside-diphosphate reductase alpha chain